MPELFKTLLYVIIAVSLIGGFMAAIDKYNAIHGFHRISEATLMLFGLCGGALFMFAVMKLIRHKTRKPKFMITFPLLSIAQVIVLILCYFKIAIF